MSVKNGQWELSIRDQDFIRNGKFYTHSGEGNGQSSHKGH